MEAVIQDKREANASAKIQSEHQVSVNHDHLERWAIICCRGLLGRPRTPNIHELYSDRVGRYLATLGAQVTTVLPVEQDSGLHESPLTNHQYCTGGLHDHLRELASDSVDMIVFRHQLQLYRLAEARLVLIDIRRVLRRGARLYLSCAGLKSELSIGYPATKPLADRHTKLSKSMAQKYGIHDKVTLYSTAEICTLVSEAGYDVESIWLSDEGHLNCCAVNRS